MPERCPECNQLGGHRAGCKRVEAIEQEVAKVRRQSLPKLRAPLLTVLISLGVILGYKVTEWRIIARSDAMIEGTGNTPDDYKKMIQAGLNAVQMMHSPQMTFFRTMASLAIIIFVVALLRLVFVIIKRADGH